MKNSERTPRQAPEVPFSSEAAGASARQAVSTALRLRRASELEIENLRLQRLISELLIKNQQLRAELAGLLKTPRIPSAPAQ